MAGCLVTVAILFILALVLGGAGWYFYEKFADEYTSAHSIDLRIPPPTTAETQHAENTLSVLHGALVNHQATTVRFTARDLNTLIARSPDFDDMRNRVRVDIANSLLLLELSVPLSETQLPRLRERWFNGSLLCSFSYHAPNFTFDPKEGRAGDKRLPSWLLSRNFATSFSGGFTKGFRKAVQKREGDEAWDGIERIEVRGDELIITTRAGADAETSSI